jgi:excisionase family DNA binding protein
MSMEPGRVLNYPPAPVYVSNRADTVAEKKYLDINAAAELLGFSVQTLYGWTSQRAIPHYKKGGRLRFDRHELIRWMERGRREVIELD